MLASRRQFLMSGMIVTLTATRGWAVNRQRACSRCNVPLANYHHDAIVASVRDFAVANDPALPPSSLRRPFHFRSLNMDLAHLRLYQIGLAIDGAEGKLLASGRILHNGGDGGMKGSHVLVHLRAYEATAANASLLTPDARQLPPDAAVVWGSSHRFWVPVGDQLYPLVPPVQPPEQQLALQSVFRSITHIEVELSYLRDK